MTVNCPECSKSFSSESDMKRHQAQVHPTEEKFKNKDWLKAKYHDEKLSTGEIADLCDTYGQKIGYWLRKYDIPRRCNSEATELEWKKSTNREVAIREMKPSGWSHTEESKRKIGKANSGENNGMWKEEVESSFGQRWSRKREEVIERLGPYCRVCKIKRHEHQQKYGVDLNIHHIIPRRKFKNVNEANRDDNLTVLCLSCHKSAEHSNLKALARSAPNVDQFAPTC